MPSRVLTSYASRCTYRQRTCGSLGRNNTKVMAGVRPHSQIGTVSVKLVVLGAKLSNSHCGRPAESHKYGGHKNRLVNAPPLHRRPTSCVNKMASGDAQLHETLAFSWACRLDPPVCGSEDDLYGQGHLGGSVTRDGLRQGRVVEEDLTRGRGKGGGGRRGNLTHPAAAGVLTLEGGRERVHGRHSGGNGGGRGFLVPATREMATAWPQGRARTQVRGGGGLVMDRDQRLQRAKWGRWQLTARNVLCPRLKRHVPQAARAALVHRHTQMTNNYRTCSPRT